MLQGCNVAKEPTDTNSYWFNERLFVSESDDILSLTFISENSKSELQLLCKNTITTVTLKNVGSGDYGDTIVLFVSRYSGFNQWRVGSGSNLQLINNPVKLVEYMLYTDSHTTYPEISFSAISDNFEIEGGYVEFNFEGLDESVMDTSNPCHWKW
jgi:hypothetical protein